MIKSELFCILILFITRCYSAMEGFIEGGTYAKIESFPHSVYLYMGCRDHQTCGGSILTQHIILTAGHCFDGCSKKHEKYAYAGSEDTNLMLVAAKIINYVIHKQYKKFELLNDIALGTLKSPIPLGKTMKRVIIARNFPDVTMARTAGWGIVNDETNEETVKLKMVTQILEPTRACNQVVTLREGMMCAKNNYKNHPTRQMESYIVGGQTAKIDQFPHAVFLLLACTRSEGAWSCGASVLTQNLVLTAAHCFRTCSKDVNVLVYLGSAEIQKMVVVRHVSFFVIHEGFDAKTLRDDIALARTENDMPLGKNIKRVIIRRSFPGVSRAEIAGWGTLDESKPVAAERLQWLPQTIRLGGICSAAILSPGMMCVENNRDNHPSPGDSGCALTTNLVQQIGLVSHRLRARTPLVVYTNVSYYYDWIQWSAGQLTCNAV